MSFYDPCDKREDRSNLDKSKDRQAPKTGHPDQQPDKQDDPHNTNKKTPK